MDAQNKSALVWVGSIPDGLYNVPLEVEAIGDGLLVDSAFVIPWEWIGQAAAQHYDGDGLSNAAEIALGTNPADSDTDDDTVSDGDEAAAPNRNPLVWDGDAGWQSLLPAVAQAEQAGSQYAVDVRWSLAMPLVGEIPAHTYRIERRIGTLPWIVLAERQASEVIDATTLNAGSYRDIGLVPRLVYTYRVSLTDGIHQSPPVVTNSVTVGFNLLGDDDGDGLNNLQEMQAGSAPDSTDSDGDGRSDTEEIADGTDPNSPFDVIDPGGGGGGSGGGTQEPASGPVAFTSFRVRTLSFVSTTIPNVPTEAVPGSGGDPEPTFVKQVPNPAYPGPAHDGIDADADGDKYEAIDPRDNIPPVPEFIWVAAVEGEEGAVPGPTTPGGGSEFIPSGPPIENISQATYKGKNAYKGAFQGGHTLQSGDPNFDLAMARTTLDQTPYHRNSPDTGWQGNGFRGISAHTASTTQSLRQTSYAYTYTNNTSGQQHTAQTGSATSLVTMRETQFRLQTNYDVQPGQLVEQRFAIIQQTTSSLDDDPVENYLGSVTLSIDPPVDGAPLKVSNKARKTGSVPDDIVAGSGEIWMVAPYLALSQIVTHLAVKADIIPDDGMSGVYGDMVPSINSQNGQKHFVSPKEDSPAVAGDDYLVFVARGLKAEDFAIKEGASQPEYSWESESGAIENIANSPHRFRVKRNEAKHVIVHLKRGQMAVDTIHVWVVWAITRDTRVGDDEFDPSEQNMQAYVIPSIAEKRWRFLFDIEPKNLFVDDERPALNGAAESKHPAPGTGKLYSFDPEKGWGDSAENKWDISRQYSVTILNPDGIPKNVFTTPVVWFINQPQDSDTPVSFPLDDAEGNDDPFVLGGDEETNPYEVHETVVPQAMYMEHDIGQMTSIDSPQLSVSNLWLASQQPYERHYSAIVNFNEFARVQLWDGNRSNGKYWFRISPLVPWHHALRAKGDAFKWQNGGSSSGNGHYTP